MTEQQKFVLLLIKEGQLTINEIQQQYLDRFGKWITRDDIFQIYLSYMLKPIFLVERRQNKLFLRRV